MIIGKGHDKGSPEHVFNGVAVHDSQIQFEIEMKGLHVILIRLCNHLQNLRGTFLYILDVNSRKFFVMGSIVCSCGCINLLTFLWSTAAEILKISIIMYQTMSQVCYDINYIWSTSIPCNRIRGSPSFCASQSGCQLLDCWITTYI